MKRPKVKQMANRLSKPMKKKKKQTPVAANAAVLDLTRRALEMMKRVQTANGAQPSQEALVPGGNTYALPEPLFLHATGF
jgi:hypothetical protein